MAAASRWLRDRILAVLKSRHRAESVYTVGNLTQVLSLVGKTANALTIVLLLFATITLVAGGVGIMNIMLATVSARIREIGIRKAVGATRREIELQFLSEAVMISLIGGTIGTLAGLALPISLWIFTAAQAPGLRAVRGDRDGSFLPHWCHLWHAARQECVEIRSGGISETRIIELSS